MKNAVIFVVLIVAVIAGYYAFNGGGVPEGNSNQANEQGERMAMNPIIDVQPIEHATAVLTWGDTVIYTDPVGGAEAFDGQPQPDLILLTDIHGDHLHIDTLEAVVKEDTVLVAPPAVTAELPAVPGLSDQPLASRVIELKNSESAPFADIMITAIPMYNVPESDDAYHVKGRGNGYILEKEGTRVYISGDTGDTPELRALENIDLAFVSMNLPYTMDVETAANAVLEFKPKQVIPYHYRGTDGLSDVARFKQLVNDGDPNIDVLLLNWYPESD